VSARKRSNREKSAIEVRPGAGGRATGERRVREGHLRSAVTPSTRDVGEGKKSNKRRCDSYRKKNDMGNVFLGNPYASPRSTEENYVTQRKTPGDNRRRGSLVKARQEAGT